MTLISYQPRSAFQRGGTVAKIAFVSFLFALLIATHWPTQHIPQLAGIRWSDKVYHFVSYAALTGLLLWAVRSSSPSQTRRTFTICWRGPMIWCGVLFIGLIDEVTQPIVGRSCSVFDLIADAAGSGLIIAMATFASFTVLAIRKPPETLEWGN